MTRFLIALAGLCFACCGAAARGEPLDGAALQKALEAADSRAVSLPRGRVYVIRSTLRIPAGLDVDFNGSTVRRATSNRSSAFQVLVGPGAAIRNLTLEIPAGVTVNRGIDLADGAKALNVTIASVNQQANTGHQEHAALNVHGDDTEIAGLRIENFDAALRCEGNSSGGRWSDITIVSYVQAIDLDVCSHFLLTRYLAHTRSPNARTSPGHNGLTMRGTRFGRLQDLDIRDSGEHGIYVAGGPVAHRRLRFADVRVTRPGQCGLKIRNAAALSTDIVIDGLEVVDAHFGNKPGTNEDGLRIERAEDVVVTGFSLRRQENARSSAYDGIYITGSRNVRIVAPAIHEVEHAAIHVEDSTRDIFITNALVAPIP